MSIFNRLKKLLYPKKAKEEVKEKVPETIEKPKAKKLPKKGSPEDFAALFEEMRKTLWIIKKSTAHMYVEWGNLKDKIEKKIESQKS